MTPRVLVVEDDKLIRSALAEFLRDEGYIVDEAADGRGALEVANETPPDLVLQDLNMPGMDGWVFRLALRCLRELGNVPVIVVSALPPRPDDTALLDVSAWIEKPVNLDHVLATVRRFLGAAPPPAVPLSATDFESPVGRPAD